MSSKKHPLGEKRNHPGSKLRQGFWMVFRLGVNNWGLNVFFEQWIKETVCVFKKSFEDFGFQILSI
ncbi:hypothetical protein EQH23_05840 [Streptococcus pneumoniae]|nr:hypothetical protein C1H54_05415 [Streptococcus pneumoniae]UKP58423.1 hypothetical protein EQH23_05840 [Streptococcus pneumoniae]UKP80459.1 hypothetical protein ES298_05740 [Streptococcus pneumoniae]